MGVITLEIEHVCTVTPARLFKAMVLDGHKIFPKALPNFVLSGELIEGDGGPGSILKFTLADGYLKEKVDEVDKENYVYHYTIVEGTVLKEPVEKVSYEYKLEASPDGGCIIKATEKHYTKGDAQLSEEFLKANKERSAWFTKSVEDYLLANPDYN